jgi:S1-C subfamily serine protease
MAGGMVFLLLSVLVSLGQNLFLDPLSFPVDINEPSGSTAIVETVGQKQHAVVGIKGYGVVKIRVPLVQITSGTGFIVSSDGTVLTNRHVVDNSDMKYRVITSNGLRYSVDNVYLDPKNDIAVIKIDPQQHNNYELKTVELGDSTKLTPGQEVAALGDDPGKLKPTMLTGVVSGIGNTILADDFQKRKTERLHNMIQTDLDLVPGNSGSPLFDSSGSVVGINTATSSYYQNASYAIPINSAKNFLETVK